MWAVALWLGVLGGAVWAVRWAGGSGPELFVLPLLLLVYVPPLCLQGLALLLEPATWAALADALLPVLVLGRGWGLALLVGRPLLEPALARLLPALPPSLFGRHSALVVETALDWGWPGRRLLRLLPGAGGLAHCALRWAAEEPASRRFSVLAALYSDLRLGTSLVTCWLGERSARHLLFATDRALRTRRLPVPLDPTLDSALCDSLACLKNCFYDEACKLVRAWSRDLIGLILGTEEEDRGAMEWLNPVLSSFKRLLRQPGAASPLLRQQTYFLAGILSDWYSSKLRGSGDGLRVPGLDGVLRAALASVRRPAGQGAEVLQRALALFHPQSEPARSFGRKSRRRLLRSVLSLLRTTDVDLSWALHPWEYGQEFCLPTEARRTPGALAGLVGRARGGEFWAAAHLLRWLSIGHTGNGGWHQPAGAGAGWTAVWPWAHLEPADEEKFLHACESEGVYAALVEGWRAVLAAAPPLLPNPIGIVFQEPSLDEPYRDLRPLLRGVQELLSCQAPRLAARRAVAKGELRSAGLGTLVAELHTAASAWPQTADWAAELGELAAALGPTSAIPDLIARPLDDGETAEKAYFAQRNPNVPLKLRWDLHQPLARPGQPRPTPQLTFPEDICQATAD